MQGLVLEGGTFRPIFSSGVMDALLSADIMLPYCIGVSAGISDGVSYISRQKGRNLEIVQKYRNDKRYVGKRNYRKCRSLFGLDFVFGEIPDELVPFDKQTFMDYEGSCIAGVTNAETGEAEYMDTKKMDKKYSILRATCAMPMFFPAIEIEGQKYYDGGIADPVPVKKAVQDGCDKLVIVLTQPKGFVKRIGKYDRLGARVLAGKFPAMREAILSRADRYNEIIKTCEQMEKEGKAIIIRPNYLINSFEDSVKKLEAAYWHGYRMTKERMKRIRKFLGGEDAHG
ncbi:MAG: patatin family protein [Eubacterium sp.]|jgi:predicted patatin/cPLA2 family phospholipase|nr:patatin family protein [Eubacterium sp.]